MGREIKRVSVGFDWPLYEVWQGFLMPDALDETKCLPCGGSGYSAHAQNLQDLWYGDLPFDPATTGSTPWSAEAPAIRRRAEWNVKQAPEYYLERPVIDWTDPVRHEEDIARARAARSAESDAERVEAAVRREAARLADYFNTGWSHHLNQDDVDALVEAGRLHDFTHTWTKGEGWEPIEPTPTVTAEQVNEWSLTGFAHDSMNCWVVVKARCERDGMPDTCQLCLGHGSSEAYPGQRAEAEAWERAEPPKGEGWQLWETTSEGSPISPVFAIAEDLATWMSNPDRDDRYAKDWMPYPAAMQFIKAGWAPTFIGTASTGIVQGAEFIGMSDSAEAEAS